MLADPERAGQVGFGVRRAHVLQYQPPVDGTAASFGLALLDRLKHVRLD